MYNNTYVIAIKTDYHGIINFHVNAKDYASAKKILSTAENCPQSAMTLVCIKSKMPYAN